MKKFIKLALIPVLMGSFAFNALADNTVQGTHHDKSEPTHKIGRGIERLNLTDTQKQLIAELIVNHDAQKTQVVNHKDELRALVLNNEFDEPKIKALIKEQIAQRETNQLAKLRLQHEIFKVLTPEQQMQFTTNLEKKQNARNESKNNKQGNKGQRHHNSGEGRKSQSS